MEHILSPFTSIVARLPVPLPAVSLCTRDHDCISFEAREERQLGSRRRQRIILRLADALIVMDSRLVIRGENTCTSRSMVTTNSFEALGADLNSAMINYLRPGSDCFYFLHFSSPDYVDPINAYVEIVM